MMDLNNSTSSSNSSLDDDELTNLTWLQDNNLLQNMTSNHNGSKSPSTDCNLKEDNENVSPKKIKLDNNIKEIDLEKNIITTNSGTTMPCSVPPVRYNPLLHTHTKPPYSFSSLIFMAIESSATKAAPVKDIYNWISKNFPYYKHAPDGWKNTVRHNLSLNRCFKKVEKNKKFKTPNEGRKLLNDQMISSKGSLWCVEPNSRPNLLQAIKKTPAHIYPYMSTAKTGSNLAQISNIINSNDNQQLITNCNRTNNIDINNVNSTVTIGNATTNISPSNNLLTINSPDKKIITLEKLPQKNILTAAKRVLIPITKVRREAKEADAAESMLTLTQCNTTGNVNNGNMYYIITNKGENQQLVQIQLAPKQAINTPTTPVKPQPIIKNQISTIGQNQRLLQIQLAPKQIINTTATAVKPQPLVKNQRLLQIQLAPKQTINTTTAAVKPQPLVKNQIVFLTQPIQTPNQSTATISIPISSPQKQIKNSAISTTTSSSQLTTSIDHNYSSRSSTTKTINNLITIPPKPMSTVGCQPKFILATTAANSPLLNSAPVNKNVHKVITITSAKQSPAKNVIIKAIVKKPEEKKTTNNNKKEKVDNVVNDEDGLKCAEALFNLANGSKMTKNVAEKKIDKKVEKSKDQAVPATKKTGTLEIQTLTIKSPAVKIATSPIKSPTIQIQASTIKSPTVQIQTIKSPTLTRSAAKKLKTSS